MKQLIIALALMLALTTASHADVVAEMPNEGGGVIQLTDERCTIPSAGEFKVMSYIRSGGTLTGCWSGDSGSAINVMWLTYNGERIRQFRMYAPEAFTLTPYGERVRDGARRQRY